LKNAYLVILFYFFLTPLLAKPTAHDYVEVKNVSSNDVLNVRYKPDWKSIKVAELAHNSKCLINIACNDGFEFRDVRFEMKTDENKNSLKQQRWCKVNYGESSGWVLAQYLSFDKNCTDQEVNQSSPIIKSWSYTGIDDLKKINDNIKKDAILSKKWVLNPRDYLDNMFLFLGKNEEEYEEGIVSTPIIKYSFNSLHQPDYMVIDDIHYSIGGGDSVRGYVQQLVFKQINHKFGKKMEDMWNVVVIKYAQRCWRTENKEVFSAEPCP
jgi:hypothetical protein